ncbi:hypothetical protein WOC09_23805 [Vibrio parahaemolyticus]|uniref:hypothetical protein n=1 Tax=Vibrio parahaemolyticus TaxID=670 RepID=UPI00112028A5|nr:hypothetical protein [Vibrio parahaemolyticus]EJI1399420.1 hypothetical protein [Vibrio parahaemolyticus]MBM4910051.1 hypothetical protein [Vibrio parahaemolyticus]MCX8941445.1 hypothetical protein [Vibrio parahaemolyticus]MDF5576003.1 hypothetical protein [Vibrio parahaemolyticus]MDG2903588.1 hypothetical protein [Vibrio parahaemolyticus]
MRQIEVILDKSEPINLAISSSTDWPTILVGCGSVLTGIAVAYISRANQVTQNKAKTAELRQRWLEDLRECLASLISLSGIMQLKVRIDSDYPYSNEGLELAKQIAKLEVNLSLMLDKDKDYTLIIKGLVKDMMDVIMDPHAGEDFIAYSIALEEQSNRVLEKAWKDIRKDLEN